MRVGEGYGSEVAVVRDKKAQRCPAGCPSTGAQVAVGGVVDKVGTRRNRRKELAVVVARKMKVDLRES